MQFVIRNEQKCRLVLGSIPSRSFDLFVLSESALKVLAMTEDYVNPDFSLADGHGYLLDRSHAAACRLNLQFYLWKDAIKFNSHPSIPVQKCGIIADVATGIGMWLIDVARELPTAQIEGFDIDLSQAPP